MKSRSFSIYQSQRAWEHYYYNDPPSVIGARPSVNILMQPGVSESNQDNISANLHELAEIIRRDERVDELTQRLKGYMEYGLDAKWNHLPYVNPTIIHRQAKDEIPPQRYYYAVIVVMGDEYDYFNTPPDRSEAEAWRDRLFTDFPRKVRLAYVAPTHDRVYLICQGYYDGSVNDRTKEEADGGYNTSFRWRWEEEQQAMMDAIYYKYRNCDTPINAFRARYCYISSDPDARWRAFIKDKT